MNTSPSGLSSFFSIERVVAFLTPTVFAPLAVWISGLVATNVPFAPTPSPGVLEGIEIAAFLGACGVVIKWLHGRQIPAIAGLTPALPISAAELDTFFHQIQTYLQAHPESFQGPAGATGASASQEAIDAAAEGAVKRLLGNALGGQAQPVV